jgi:eukaryotic-like serine/threonine-protein kinase
VEAGRQVVGRYRLERKIGSGGMGVVWLATDTQLDRPVALKRALDPADRRALEGMRREARNIGRLPHEHIVTLHDLVVDGDEVWLVMEYVTGGSLAELITAGPVAPTRAARIGAQIADALAVAHAGGVLHRDVKPSNVLFARLAAGDEQDRVTLTDFGIARRDDDATLTDGVGVGTPAYMAPEVARDEPATAASDVYSLGATVYAAVFGSPPFGTSGNPHMIKRRVGAAVGVVDIPGGAGPLEPALARLLARDPADRPTAEGAASLLHAVTGDTSRPPRPRGVARASRRRPLLVVGAVAAALLVVAGVVAVTMLLLLRPAAPAPAPAAAGHTAAASGLGDIRTVDPCALTDPAALQGFGRVERDPARGNFARCDVMVTSAPGNTVDVKTELFGADPGTPAPDASEDVGIGRLVRGEDDGEACTRRLLLPDGNAVDVTARQQDDEPSNRCGMAETAAQSAVAVLRRGPVPRRAQPFAASSLANLDACTLPPAAALSEVPGLGAPTPGFADWSCRFDNVTGPGGVQIVFDRNEPFTAEDGQLIRVGDRDAVVEPGGWTDNGCAVDIVHRGYQNADGDTVDEVVIVDVAGAGPVAQLCAPATRIATAVAAALPAP